MKISKLRDTGSKDIRKILFTALWDPPGKPRRSQTVLNLPRVRDTIENRGQPGDIDFVVLDADERGLLSPGAG